MNRELAQAELREAERGAGEGFLRDLGLPQGLYRVSEAAMLLGISPKSIYRWFRRGRIPFYGFRGSYRVRLRDLLPERRKPPKP